MMKPYHFILLCFCLFIGLTVQSKTIDSSSWNVSYLGVDDGLPDATVFSIQQEQSGYLWFGTTQGIARYDGYNFLTFQYEKENNNSISNNNAGNLFIDSKNRLWVGTFGGGLNVIDLQTHRIKRYSYINKNPNITTISSNVQTLFEDHKSRIWVGTDAGLYLIDEHNLEHFAYNPDIQNSIGHPRIWDVLQTESNQVWVGTSNGLSLFDDETKTFSNFKLPEELQIDGLIDEFRTLYADNNKAIWIGASSGLFRFDIESKSFEYFSPFNHSYKINKILKFNENQLLVATLDGLYSFNLKNRKFNQDKNLNIWRKFAEYDIRDIKQDQSGLLWLTTRYGGVIKIDLFGSPFKFHDNTSADTNSPFQSKRINAIEKDSLGSLYLGTVETVYKYTKEGRFSKIGYLNLDAIPGNIQSIHASKFKNGVWIGSTKGLYFLDSSAKTAVAVVDPFELSNMDSTNIYSIEETQSGDLWLGLFNKGILYWDRKSNQSDLNIQNKTNLLTNISITSTLEDNQQNIWFGSRLGGLFRYNPITKNIQVFTNNPENSNSISSNLIRDIYQDSSNNIWIATSKGLNLYDFQQDAFIRINSSDGLLGDSLQSIIEDEQKDLWIASQFGISRFNPKSMQSQNYGLNINNDALIQRSVVIDDEGKLFFGSNNGFYTLNTSQKFQNKIFQPQLVITNIQVNNEFIDFSSTNNEFEFDNLARLITFEFASLDFKSPKQNRYKYRIKEISKNWVNESHTRKVTINNFKPGNYTIEVMGTNSNGHWSPHQLKFEVKILPAWWNTLEMRVIIAFLILLLLFALYKFRMYKYRQHNLQLETEVANRTKELIELNKKLEISAHTDYLTGLPNRKSFIQTFKSKVRNRYLGSKNIYVVMADIDYFKKVNDTYGHNAGDLALIELSQLIKSKLRANEIIARWGGEEFLLCLMEEDSQKAKEFVEQIRSEAEKLELSYKDQKIKLSLTFGIAEFQSSMTIDQCIRNADNALYQGKNNGRNQVVLHKSQ